MRSDQYWPMCGTKPILLKVKLRQATFLYNVIHGVRGVVVYTGQETGPELYISRHARWGGALQ